VLAVLQCVGHGVERVGDSRDFGFIPDLHAPRIFAEPPLVRGTDQFAKRTMDEPAGAKRCQDQHQRGAQDDQKDVAPCAILDLSEGLRLVDAIADKKPPGIGVQG
jgi:hypothetical protein